MVHEVQKVGDYSVRVINNYFCTEIISGTFATLCVEEQAMKHSVQGHTTK